MIHSSGSHSSNLCLTTCPVNIKVNISLSLCVAWLHRRRTRPERVVSVLIRPAAVWLMWNQNWADLRPAQIHITAELWRTKPHQNTWSADGPGQMFRGFKCSWSWHGCHSNRCSSCLQLPWKHYGWPSVKTTHYFYVAPVRSGKKTMRQPRTDQTASTRGCCSPDLFTQKAKKYLSTKGKSQETAIPWIFILKVIWASFSFDFIIIYLCFLNLWLAKTHKLLLPHFRFR